MSKLRNFIRSQDFKWFLATTAIVPLFYAVLWLKGTGWYLP